MPQKRQGNSEQNAPDPASSYERAKPEKQSGMGRLDNNKATPSRSADRVKQAVKNKQSNRQINSEDSTDQRAEGRPSSSGTKGENPAPKQPDHSMKDEEPLGWDQAPTEKQPTRNKRHPRKEGRGGV